MLQGIYSPQNDRLRRLQDAIDEFNNQPVVPALQPAQSKKIPSVSGFDGARKRQDQLAPGESEIVADDRDDILYILSKDADGNCPRKIMFSRFKIEYEPDPPRYVTQDDLELFKKDILDALKGDQT